MGVLQQQFNLLWVHTMKSDNHKPQISKINESTCFLSRMNPYAGLVDCLRATWLTGKTRPMEYRQGQLEALNRFLEERRSDLLHALNQDMRRVSVVIQVRGTTRVTAWCGFSAQNGLC